LASVILHFWFTSPSCDIFEIADQAVEVIAFSAMSLNRAAHFRRDVGCGPANQFVTDMNFCTVADRSSGGK